MWAAFIFFLFFYGKRKDALFNPMSTRMRQVSLFMALSGTPYHLLQGLKVKCEYTQTIDV